MLSCMTNLIIPKKNASAVYQLFCTMLLLILISFRAAAETPQTVNKTNFVILIYHHVSSDTPPATSISTEQFAAHLEYLAEHHNVIPLEDALAALETNSKLPDRSVVITFDDGYANIFENGYPLLKSYDFPFTIFINPEEIGNRNNQLSWQQIKEMEPLGTFANHTIGHLHLLDRLQDENEESWLSRVIDNIQQAEQMIEENIGYSKRWLAYPYGEYNNALKNTLSEMQYIGLSQQSGAVSTYTDMGAIPRFPAAGIYANLNTLKVKLNSLAMPVKSTSLNDTVFAQTDVMDKVTLSITETPDMRLQQITCFFKNATLERDITDWEVTIELNQSLSPGRHRINCTAPSNSQRGRFYWHSIPFFVPTDEGVFVD